MKQFLKKTLSKFYFENGTKYQIIVNISIHDDCKNGYREFSLTCEGYGYYKNGRKYDAFGGCAHEEILKHFPELEIFANLHLCNIMGQPMYAVENGYYLAKNKGYNDFKNYLRLNDDEALYLLNSEDQQEFKYKLCTSDIIGKWTREAQKGIEILESLTGEKFDYSYNGETSHFIHFSEEEKKEYDKKVLSGYYKEEAKTRRKEEAKEAKKQKEIETVIKEYNEATKKMQFEKDLKLFLLSYNIEIDNIIYYSHDNSLKFNWLDYKSQLSNEEIEKATKLLKGSDQFNNINIR